MANVVEVVDSIMGSSKTSNIIHWMEANPNERYLYISPLLSEVGEGGRLSQNVRTITFEYPSTQGIRGKGDHLLDLLQEGANISCTHSLYMSLTEDHLKLIGELGYNLIIDEEVDVIDGFDRYSKNDSDWLYRNRMIEYSAVDGMISWVGDPDLGKDHKYYMFKQYCDSQCLYVTKRSETMMVTQLPIRLMTVAKRVIVLTYLFQGNVLDSFLRLKGVEVKPFTEIETTKVSKQDIRSLINLLPLSSETKNLGLTSSWYRNAKKPQLDRIEKHIRNVANKCKVNFDDLMYTFPKERHVGSSSLLIKPKGYYRKRLSDGSFQYCWLPAQTRATNEYANKSVLVHCFDRFPLVSVEAYLQDYGFPIDRSVFALSEMLQWIWRSRIRNGEGITISIASKRMYNLFTDWLNID